ncbi:hypothetical protein LCM10_04465 [Rossellomorea aquimaris]|uniref:hypothetical protein n=1 Tax=Rossellomorea aquimaris TaxID=189382 RepID=UPI001CD70162|nr:hypothetical protein [Rossellomorea aquimaris]MCA1054231.1 hypothetical protein [Rossellomorea aquimaris]
MVKRKNVVIFVLLVIALTTILVGWSVSRGKMHDLNDSELTSKMERATPNAKIPTKVPFDELQLYEFGSRDQGITFTLFNADKEFITIKIMSEEIEYPKEIKKETIKIGNDVNGTFMPDHSGKRMITWEQEGMYYEIAYAYKLTASEVSKGQLVEMAGSFK